MPPEVRSIVDGVIQLVRQGRADEVSVTLRDMAWDPSGMLVLMIAVGAPGERDVLMTVNVRVAVAVIDVPTEAETQ
jgi:hypothetical protein